MQMLCRSYTSLCPTEPRPCHAAPPESLTAARLAPPAPCCCQECKDLPAVKKMLETAKAVLGYDLLQARGARARGTAVGRAGQGRHLLQARENRGRAMAGERAWEGRDGTCCRPGAPQGQGRAGVREGRGGTWLQAS